MKKILVTPHLAFNSNYQETKESLDISWGTLLEKCNLVPVIFPYGYNIDKYLESFHFDGILLTGGNDLNSLNASQISLLRDNLEIKLISYGIKNDIPILGVCRGLQIIAHYFGSSFIKIDGQVNIKHQLKVNGDSLYFQQLNLLDYVNSYHDYGIDKISDQLLVSAISKEGIIKAIEHKHYKIFAHFWHPERTTPYNRDEIKLITTFFYESYHSSSR